MGPCSSRPNFVQTSEHCHENIKVNDAFFSILSLFEEETCSDFPILKKTIYRYRYPSPNFLAQESAGPPRLLLEIRKGKGFRNSSQLTAVVTLHPSEKEYRSDPANPRLPRWYFLICHTYNTQEFDTHADIAIMQRDQTVIGTLQVPLNRVKNKYLVRWFPVDSTVEEKHQPYIELRLWNLTDPQSFWDVENKHYCSAIEEISSQ